MEDLKPPETYPAQGSEDFPMSSFPALLPTRESLLYDLSEARQLEMAIQLSLLVQEAQSAGAAGDEPDHADAADAC